MFIRRMRLDVYSSHANAFTSRESSLFIFILRRFFDGGLHGRRGEEATGGGAATGNGAAAAAATRHAAAAPADAEVGRSGDAATRGKRAETSRSHAVAVIVVAAVAVSPVAQRQSRHFRS